MNDLGCIGLSDKLYWRPVGGAWHCFKRTASAGDPFAHRFVSLCGRYGIDRSGGQSCNRPLPVMRCGLCDGREAKRRGKDDSVATSPDFDADRHA